jgi:uncharacterized protein with LGFP repeats
MVETGSEVPVSTNLEANIMPIDITVIPPAGEPLEATLAIEQKQKEAGFLGNPISEIKSTSRHGGGYFQRFEFGAIFFSPHPEAGTHEVHGAIWDKFKAMGELRSFLGFPVTDESDEGAGRRFSRFQNGTIHWRQDSGTFLDLSLDAFIDERFQDGSMYIEISGSGFTPGSAVRFQVEGLTGAAGPKSIGIFTNIDDSTTFSKLFWLGKKWPQGGTALLRALDAPTGQSATVPIPALY